jgi:hypothetical protein
MLYVGRREMQATVREPEEQNRHDVGWNSLAQYRDKWRTLLNVVMNYRCP